MQSRKERTAEIIYLNPTNTAPPFQLEEQVDAWTEEVAALHGDQRTNRVDVLCRDHPELADDLRDAVSCLEIVEQRGVHDLGPDQRIGRYRLVKKIGEGGTAKVWTAVDEQVGRTVALKLFRAASEDDGSRTTLAEARSLVKLERTGRARGDEDPFRYLVQVFDAGKDGDYEFIAMELPTEVTTDGEEPARNALDHPPNSLAQALEWWEQAARGLELAHRNRVFHGDVKPANVLVLPSGDAIKLADFGVMPARGRALEQVADVDPRYQTTLLTKDRTSGRPKIISGTPMYMSPEQAFGFAPDPTNSPEYLRLLRGIDVFGLGALFYYFVSGRAVHEPEDGDAASCLRAARTFAPTRLRARNPFTRPTLRFRVPARVERVLMKTLASKPESRYATAGKLADDIRALRTGGTTSLEENRVGLRSWVWLRNNRLKVVNVAMWSTAIVGALLVAHLKGLHGAVSAQVAYEQDKLEEIQAKSQITVQDLQMKLAALGGELRAKDGALRGVEVELAEMHAVRGAKLELASQNVRMGAEVDRLTDANRKLAPAADLSEARQRDLTAATQENIRLSADHARLVQEHSELVRALGVKLDKPWDEAAKQELVSAVAAAVIAKLPKPKADSSTIARDSSGTRTSSPAIGSAP